MRKKRKKLFHTSISGKKHRYKFSWSIIIIYRAQYTRSTLPPPSPFHEFLIIIPSYPPHNITGHRFQALLRILKDTSVRAGRLTSPFVAGNRWQSNRWQGERPVRDKTRVSRLHEFSSISFPNPSRETCFTVKSTVSLTVHRSRDY